MPKWVKLKEYGSTKEMNRKRVGVKNFKFIAGKWVSDVPDDLAEYLMKNEIAPSGDPYFVVADTMIDAVNEASKSQQFNVFLGGTKSSGGAPLSDGELLAKAAAANLAASAKTKPKKKKSKPKVEPTPEPKAEPKQVPDHAEVMARISAAIGNSKIADALDDFYGEDLYMIVKSDPGALSAVDGVGKGRIKRIVEALEDV